MTQVVWSLYIDTCNSQKSNKCARCIPTAVSVDFSASNEFASPKLLLTISASLQAAAHCASQEEAKPFAFSAKTVRSVRHIVNEGLFVEVSFRSAGFASFKLPHRNVFIFLVIESTSFSLLTEDNDSLKEFQNDCNNNYAPYKQAEVYIF